MRPPIEWPTSATSCTSTGHAPDQLLEQRRDGQTVFRDVQAGVVAQVHRGAAEVRGQARAVGVARVGATPIPVELGPHQAVEEHNQPRRRVGEHRVQRARVKRHGLAVHTHRGRLVKVASRALEPVADQAVEGGDHGAPRARRREQDLLPDPPPLDRCVGGPSQSRRAGSDRVVGAARKRVVDQLDRAASRPHAAERALGDAQMRVANRAGKIPQLLEAQRGQRPHLVGPVLSRLAVVAYRGAGRFRAGHAASPSRSISLAPKRLCLPTGNITSR